VRLVFDTNVLVAALRSDRGASRKLLLGALDRTIKVIASVPLIIEYEAVLTRPGHLAAAGLSIEEVNTVLDAFVAVAEPVQLHFSWRPRLKDPGDEMVLETAVEGYVDRLVSFNLRHLRSAAQEFGILVLVPSEAWKEVQRRDAKK
jgi:putative PIN family toxin of toxin-antitoxin system